MKHTISGFIYHVSYDFRPDEFTVCFNKSDTMGKADPDWVLIGPHSFDVELPDDFDPRPAKIAALEEAKRKARADFAARITELDAQIQSLLAIENTAEA
jgi:hypothetical protein